MNLNPDICQENITYGAGLGKEIWTFGNMPFHKLCVVLYHVIWNQNFSAVYCKAYAAGNPLRFALNSDGKGLYFTDPYI